MHTSNRIPANVKWCHSSNEHNLQSCHLEHWRHHQRNFNIAHFQIHNNRSSSCVTDKHTKQLDWPSRKNMNAASVEEFLPCPSETPSYNCDSIFHCRNEREVGLEHVETLGEDQSFVHTRVRHHTLNVACARKRRVHGNT